MSKIPNSPAPLLALVAAVFVSSFFTSCVYDNPGPPYNSYRNVPGASIYRTSAYGGPRPYYRDNYYSSSSHYDHGYNNYGNRSDKERVKLTGGKQSGKGTRPDGYHTRDWYKKKGYNLDNYKHKHEKSGKSHSGSSYKGKSRSSSKSKSKSSSKSKGKSKGKSKKH